ncbi:transcription factor HHO6-like isoform X1 [Primulina tabacum]|uniref:transcription factor HHO6-like isoform X1 n=1 Tax=Primulina tabacum TaxID=48773 RepID=UPI003F5ABD5A
MGSLIASEFGLDPRALSASSIREFLTQVSRIHDQSERVAKLDDYVNGLEVEIKKIEVFKRELPLCMRIVNEAMVIVKEELVQYKKSKAVPVLKEFIPLKGTSDGKDEKNEISKENDVNGSDKMNWMSSFQLCNSANQNHHPNSGSGNNNRTLKLDKIKGVREEINPPMMNGILRNGINMAIGTAFVPFKGQNNFPMMMVAKEEGDKLNGLTHIDLRIKNPGEEIDSVGFSSKSSCSRSGSSSATDDQSNLRDRQKPQQMARKQRRCWSSELHRRFIDALQQLGGAQAATPKQIRDLMQVDGLSNDEVKSHLQKYRLHTRKVSTMHPSTNPVVLGGSWMSKGQYNSESSKLENSQSGSPQGHYHMQITGVSRDTSLAGGDSVDDEDGEKFESRSWKSRIQLSRRDGP